MIIRHQGEARNDNKSSENWSAKAKDLHERFNKFIYRIFVEMYSS